MVQGDRGAAPEMHILSKGGVGESQAQLGSGGAFCIGEVWVGDQENFLPRKWYCIGTGCPGNQWTSPRKGKMQHLGTQVVGIDWQ